jgi:3-oxoacyl-[acyl-carrier-protein] synthase-3
MAIGELKNVTIKGISCCLPDNKVLNTDYYEKFGKDLVDKVIRVTGINTRYVAIKEQCASDLAYTAAERLIKKLNWDKDTIKGLIFLTQSPDYRKPSTACILQYRLRLSEYCAAFDVNLGCSAFIYGIFIGSSMMLNNDINRMLVLIGDDGSLYYSPKDHSSILLFGSAGSAIALEYDPEVNNSIKYSLKTDGSRFKSIYTPAGAFRNAYTAKKELYLHDDGIMRSDYHNFMNGLDVFQFSITKVPKTIKKFLKHYKLENDMFDYLLLHQPNKLMVKKMAKKIGFPLEKIPINLDKYGNCIGSSIPLLIVDKIKTKVENGSLRLLTSGFGVGLSWGVMDLTLEHITIPDIIYSNEYYTEG